MGLDLLHYRPIAPRPGGYFESFTIAELSEYSGYVEKYKHFIVKVESDEFGSEPVIYFEEIGYQRKGMRASFYEDFESCRLYFLLADVKRAYEYSKEDHIGDLDDRQRNFRRHFVENFVEGESIFCPSW